MRTLSGPLVTAIGKQFTNPIHLVKQDMGASVIYSSTRELIDYAGDDYLATNGMEVDSLGADVVSWSLDNSDRAISILALANDVGGNAVEVFLHYEGETIPVFTGVLDEWVTRGPRTYFRATSQAARFQKFPNERAELGIFNHLPAPGTNIQWGQQTVILQSEPT
jgi:hypothetical protein